MFNLVLALALECAPGQLEMNGICICTGENTDNVDGSCKCKNGYFLFGDSCTLCPDGSIGKGGSCECTEQGQEFDQTSGLCVCTVSGQVLVDGKCEVCNAIIEPNTGRCVCANPLLDWYTNSDCSEPLRCDFKHQFANASRQCETCENGAYGGEDHVSCACPTG